MAARAPPGVAAAVSADAHAANVARAPTTMTLPHALVDSSSTHREVPPERARSRPLLLTKAGLAPLQLERRFSWTAQRP